MIIIFDKMFFKNHLSDDESFKYIHLPVNLEIRCAEFTTRYMFVILDINSNLPALIFTRNLEDFETYTLNGFDPVNCRVDIQYKHKDLLSHIWINNLMIISPERSPNVYEIINELENDEVYYSRYLTSLGYRKCDDSELIPINYNGYKNPKLLVINPDTSVIYNVGQTLIFIESEHVRYVDKFINIDNVNISEAVYSEHLNRLVMLASNYGLLMSLDPKLEDIQVSSIACMGTMWSNIAIIGEYFVLCGNTCDISVIAYSKDLENWKFEHIHINEGLHTFKIIHTSNNMFKLICYGCNGHCILCDPVFNDFRLIKCFPVIPGSVKSWMYNYKSKTIVCVTTNTIFHSDDIEI